MIFRNLPIDIIHNILLYDEHFIMRKGKIVSIIQKTDYRYNLLSFITLKLKSIDTFITHVRYNYHFTNLYKYKGRHVDNSDLMQVVIKQNKNIKYSIWIGKQYPKSFCTKEQPFLIENSRYCWKYIEYSYTR